MKSYFCVLPLDFGFSDLREQSVNDIILMFRNIDLQR